ncbi:MAG: GNAT family N-acetyltransferase [Deltaproteobacteria bacterium]|nr:GNAT family N-acetyltransferase [Deltaproteobacteria bacterium]
MRIRGLPAPTARIAFRAWRDDDLPLAMALWGDAQVSALVGGPFDEAAVRERLAIELANQRDHGIAYWPLVVDGVDAGCCGLKPRDAAIRRLELGFYLRPEYWRRGLAVEAGTSVVAHAFDTLGMASLIACHHPENHGSRAAILKLGFVYVHHELYPPTGLQHPTYVRTR